jgi:hypothetical protein
VSVLATFYGNKGGYELKERLTFHVVSRSHNNENSEDNDFDNNGKEIKTLWIKFCPP